MKLLVEFLSDLKRLDITLSANGDRLVCNAPKNAVTAEIRKELSDRKADIVAFLNETQNAPASAGIGTAEEEIPLSHSQQRLWFVTQLDLENPVYNIVMSLWLTGELNYQALERSLSAIVERHESLRTGFFERNGQPFAKVADVKGWKMAVVDLRQLVSRAAESEAEYLARIEARRPFDLEQPPLFRAAVFKVSSEKALLVSTVHHIVSDGWSLGVLLQELIELYAAFSNEEPSPLGMASFHFRDYVQWERDAGKRAADQQIPYWLQRLGGELPILEVPADRHRPRTQTFNGKRISIMIDEILAQRLRGFSRETQTTVFMVLLAAFNALLFRYTGVEDILVGSAIANRQSQEFSEIVGFFANTLILRNDLSGNPSFTELLKRVQETATAAYAHQDVPFERLVETLRPERALNHSPLVQVMFTLQNVPTPQLYFAGLKAEIAGIDPEIARAELSVEVLPRGDGYCCDFEYNTDIFDERTIRQLQIHYVRFLQAVTADPSLAIGSVPLLSQAERQQLLYGWNDTAVEFPGDKCLHQLFEEQAGKTPQATAVVFEGESLSYDELNRRANRLAHFLRQLGVKPDARVAICVGRGLEMIVGLLAILKAGGAYVPLDPTYPVDRLRYVLEDSAPTILLTQGPLRELLFGLDQSLLILDVAAANAPWREQPETDPGCASIGLLPEHLAYVIYTSGSTGQPKGVMVGHRGLCNLAVAQIRGLGVEPDSRVLQFASFSFDACIFEVLMALCRGASLYLARPGKILAGETLLEAIAQNGITHVTLPPSVLAALPETACLDSLHTLIVAGETLPPEVAKRWNKTCRLINAYGPTEATICATWHEVKTVQDGIPVEIGRPIANTRVYILDGNGQPAPVGVAGELYIGGVGVARGYLGRPEQTAEHFVSDPFAAEPGARMYRTGDLGRWLPDGNIEFLGRSDFQVKIRGFRIELGEIEARLREHPTVREAVVVTREDTPGDNRIVAYYRSTDPLNPRAADVLRAHLAAALPEHMVPSAFLVLPELPLTPNGKVNRKALPAPEAFLGERTAAMVAPRNQMEQALARMWSDILRVNPVGVRDNFFDLGGHSLLLTKVHARMRQELNSKLALLDLFRYPTIESLARAMKDGGVSPAAVMPLTSETAVRDSEHPLSRSQQRLWFLDQLNSGNAVYNITLPIRLKGHLQRRILEQALQAILDRHESLRTSFFEKDGIPYARVERAQDWEMRFADFSNVAMDSREDELRRCVEEEAGRPFVLDRGPLFRATLVRTAQQEHALILAVHHIVFDGWSGGVLARELVELMQAFLEKRDPALEPPRLQFRDFVIWEKQQQAARDLQMEYWKKQLAGEMPLLDLPTDRRRPPLQSFRGRRLRVIIAGELADQLERVSREQNATFFMVLLACFNVLLLRYSRQEDILVGTPTAGRLRSEFERLIGFFVNNLVLRTDLSGNPTFVELLKRVRATTLDALEQQSAPFDQLVEELQPERGLDRSPVFQVLFTLQNLPVQKTAFAGLEMSAFEFQTSHARYDLGVDIQAFEEGGYRCDFEYSTDLFEEETVRQMQLHYLRLLEAVAADPGLRIGSLPLLNDAEYRLIVEDWNRTESPSPGYATVSHWFRAQAAVTPDATAAVMGDLALSYAELDRQSDLLAQALRERGVRREVIVGLYVTRSLNMVVALLAILKAGGAYLPIDPALPAERIEFLLSDAGVPLILTEASLKITLPETNALLLAMDEIGEGSPATAVHWSDEEPRSEDLAYMIYTSGSTGKPKGTEITHGALVNLLSSMLREPGLRQQDALVAVTTLSFDIAGLEIFGPLVCGAKLVLASREQAVDPYALAELLEGVGGTVMQAAPSRWRTLVESGWIGKPDLRIWCGGEALAADLADNLLTRGRELWNLYGPTETTIWSAAHQISSGEDPILIGRPIANTQMYILDAQGEPVPIGVAGELYIAGDGVARGYWKRPDLTETRFVPDPFSRKPNSRMYRTGDLARYHRDGQIRLLGRTDQQIKLRGHRIELGEIEAVMERHAEVQQAVVALDGEGAGQRLIAYVKQAEDAPASDLRDWLQQRLPEYMVPSIFVTLRELPLTPNGKVDRKRLPAAERSAREQTAVSIVPRNQMERTLARIWSDVLRVSPVGIRDNFFDLGGQSLLLIKVHAKLRQELNADVPVVDLFRYPTIESMAAHLDTRHLEAVAEAVNS